MGASLHGLRHPTLSPLASSPSPAAFRVGGTCPAGSGLTVSLLSGTHLAAHSSRLCA